VHTAWPVSNFDEILGHQIEPTTLLTDWFRRVLQERKGSMIRADDDFSPQQMLTILL